MERELEVKILNIEPDVMARKLEELGAEFICDEVQINHLLSSSFFEENKSEGSYLRIRETTTELGSPKVELTLKANNFNNMLRENIEHTVIANDARALNNILSAMGIFSISKGRKHRRSYSLMGARFDIDIWDKDTYPYPYMEIEVQSEEHLVEILEAVGIDNSKVSKLSIVELQEQIRNLNK